MCLLRQRYFEFASTILRLRLWPRLSTASLVRRLTNDVFLSLVRPDSDAYPETTRVLLASLPMNINYFRRVSVEAPSAYMTAPQHSAVSGGLAWMVTCHDRVTAQVPLNSPQNHARGPSYIMISGRLIAVGVYRAVQLLIS